MHNLKFVEFVTLKIHAGVKEATPLNHTVVIASINIQIHLCLYPFLNNIFVCLHTKFLK